MQFEENRFQLIITNDGSPSLRIGDFTSQDIKPELMHHSQGAASETLYIYGEAVELAQIQFKTNKLRHLVFGLGMGYIEMTIALKSLFEFSLIESFETEQLLKEYFCQWLNNEKNNLSEAYDLAFLKLNELNAENSLSLNNFKNNMKLKIKNNEFILKPGFSKTEISSDFEYSDALFHVIHYDAFSSLTDRFFWSAEWLDFFIKKYCAPNCIFVTYSKTGELIRSLKKNGFEIIKKKGFYLKRESTLALR